MLNTSENRKIFAARGRPGVQRTAELCQYGTDYTVQVPRVNHTYLRKVGLRKCNITQGGWVRTLPLCCERDPHTGEEALHRCRRGRAAKVLPGHDCNVGELGLVLAPPHESVLLRLVLDLRQRAPCTVTVLGGRKV